MFGIADGNQNACGNDQRRADDGKHVDRFAEDQNTDKHAGDRFKGAQNRGSAAADEKGPFLEEHARTAVHHAGKQNRKTPTRGRCRERKLVGHQAHKEHDDSGKRGHPEAEVENRALFVPNRCQRNDIDRIGNARGERKKAALQIDGTVRIVKHGNSCHADRNADDVPVAELGFQDEKFAQHHNSGVDEVKDRSRSRRNVVVGAEQQKRGQTAAHHSDKQHLGQGFCADPELSVGADRQCGKQGKRKQASQKYQRERIDTVGIDIFRHQRHHAEQKCAEDDKKVSPPYGFVFLHVDSPNCKNGCFCYYSR